MDSSVFLSMDERSTSLFTSYIYLKVNAAAIPTPLKFQLLSPFRLLNAEISAIHDANTGGFKYDNWDWEELQNCFYLDKLKTEQPDTKHFFIFKDYRTTVCLLLERDFSPLDIENCNKGYFARLFWKYFKRKRVLQQLYTQKAGEYFQTWLKYNSEFLANVKKLPRESYVLLDQKHISTDDALISAYVLKNWNLSLKYVRFKPVSLQEMPADINVFLSSIKNNTGIHCGV